MNSRASLVVKSEVPDFETRNNSAIYTAFIHEQKYLGSFVIERILAKIYFQNIIVLLL